MKKCSAGSAHGRNKMDEEAVSWLQEINDYLSQNNPPAAQRIVESDLDW